jgi:predicted transcriptional regulator of viral defense system
MTRAIPQALAPLVELLELERPQTVTVEQVRQFAKEANVATPPRVAIQRLAERGWLLRTPARGVWEFAPADRAGPHSSGDPFLSLRASLSLQPESSLAVALGSAMWLLDIVDRSPDRVEIAIPPGEHVPSGIKQDCRVTRFAARLEPHRVRDLPVHRAASILVHLAHRPADVKSWSGVLERLNDLLHAAADSEIHLELEGRPHATRARLAYLISGLAPDRAELLHVEPAGVVWFGPRRPLRRFSAQWNVADTLLPFSPQELTRSP